MQFNAMLNPGQVFHEYTVYRRSATVSGAGSVSYSDAVSGSVNAVTAKLSQREIDTFAQRGHPVSLKLICMFVADVLPGDALVDGQGRRFSVSAVTDPAGLNLYTTIYCEHKPGVE